MEEHVVLVDEQNNQIGTAPKDTVHSTDTPLHRGFSIFVFNVKGELLLTKRAATKKTFPDMWTNTVCGHPAPGESVVDAAKRRLKAELGLEVSDIKEVAPYRYRFADARGIVENEICPVLVGYNNEDPTPNTQEVSSWRWVAWREFLEEIKANPTVFSPWSVAEARFIEQSISF